jgi:hypothetical protein
MVEPSQSVGSIYQECIAHTRTHNSLRLTASLSEDERRQPELLNRFYDYSQDVHAPGLSDVPVRVIVIHRMDIGVHFGGRKHEHWDPPEGLMLLYSPEHLIAADFRQIPIQKNDIGQRCAFFLFFEE